MVLGGLSSLVIERGETFDIRLSLSYEPLFKNVDAKSDW